MRASECDPSSQISVLTALQAHGLGGVRFEASIVACGESKDLLPISSVPDPLGCRSTLATFCDRISNLPSVQLHGEKATSFDTDLKLDPDVARILILIEHIGSHTAFTPESIKIIFTRLIM
jgi:hypothetical protein